MIPFKQFLTLHAGHRPFSASNNFLCMGMACPVSFMDVFFLFQYPDVGKAWYWTPGEASRFMTGAAKKCH